MTNRTPTEIASDLIDDWATANLGIEDDPDRLTPEQAADADDYVSERCLRAADRGTIRLDTQLAILTAAAAILKDRS